MRIKFLSGKYPADALSTKICDSLAAVVFPRDGRSRLRGISKGWDHPNIAREYEIFARACPLYHEMASSLVLKIVGGEDRRLVDLGAGTGISTLEMLQNVHPDSVVWAVDPSEAMLSRAREDIRDSRVRWLVGDIQALVESRGTGWVDSLLANGAIWLEPQPELFFRQVYDILASKGSFGCTLPAEYLGDIEHLLSPEARSFAKVLDSIRRAAVGKKKFVHDHGAPEPNADAAFPVTAEGVAWLLRGIGFEKVSLQREETLVTADDRARWYALPPILDAWLPGVEAAGRAAAIRELFARVSVLPPFRLSWVSIWAEKGP